MNGGAVKRLALSHEPQKVAALTDDMDIMSININRYRMEVAKVSRQLL